MHIRKLNRSLKYRHIHNKKQRKLNINSISNFIKFYNINYSIFNYLISKSNIKINRKILFDLNISEINSFKSLIYILK